MWWRRLGFERNPYFGDELDVSDFSSRLFVGREEERRSLLVDLSEDNRALVCVGGISGSGKTSFINHCQKYLYAEDSFDEFDLPRVLPCITKVQLHEGEEFNVVLLKILSSMIASVLGAARIKEMAAPKVILDLQEAIDSTVSSGGGWGVGGSAFGFGANLNRDQSKSHQDSPLGREVSLLKLIEQVAGVAVKELESDGIGVVINNIETLSEEYLLGLLNYGRDSIFNLTSIWWYLSGNPDLGRTIDTKAPRLRGFVTGTGVDISPLSAADVNLLLEKRRVEYALQADIELPVSSRIVDLLYSASGGDLRFLFNICANIVRFTVKEIPSLQLSEDIAIQAVAVLTRQHLSHYLESPDGRSVVKTWLSSKVDRVTIEDYRSFGFDSPQKFQFAMDALVKEQLLWVDRAGSSKVYSARGYLQLGIISNVGAVIH